MFVLHLYFSLLCLLQICEESDKAEVVCSQELSVYKDNKRENHSWTFKIIPKVSLDTRLNTFCNSVYCLITSLCLPSPV